MTHLAFSMFMFDYEVMLRGADFHFSFKDIFNSYLIKVMSSTGNKWQNCGNMRPVKCSLLFIH